ncbi:MAG TPA: dephospho-CoA kinase [Phycisphaerales bacterium]|nr:dephospho-CoA kinase [Phycisphaerales bacterium]
MSTIPAHSVSSTRSAPAAAAEIDGVEVIRPAGRSVIVIAFGWLVLASMLAIVCFSTLMWGSPGPGRGGLLLLPIMVYLIVLVMAAVVRNAMVFHLTPSRGAAARGVFRRWSVEVRLEDVRNVAVTRSLVQRVLGLGTIRMTAAGIGPAVVWNHVDRPVELAARVRGVIDGVRGGGAGRGVSGRPASGAPAKRPIPPVVPVPSNDTSPARLPVIGLAGGIGAGKSAVAAAFERLGCLVIDSDTRAKAALDRADVREALVSWWGPGILADDGRVDRKRVASIIFTNADERERLEGLVHPIVRDDRAQMIRDAAAAGAGAVIAVIVDAPLLFEAGVDAECDCVVFVEAPREERLRRVLHARGWDESELDRREAAQWPLDEKRARSTFVVDNGGDVGSLDPQVAGILARMRSPVAPEETATES